jgi:hypothetical protein
MIFFSLYFSINIPEGMDITPYAIKKAKGRRAARVRLRLNPLMISGFIGPNTLVRKEMTKKVSIISPTI